MERRQPRIRYSKVARSSSGHIKERQDHDFGLAVCTRQAAGTLLPVPVSTLHQIDTSSTVQHLAELEPLRRHATLTALALDLTATLTDEAFNMFEHLIGKLFKKSERAHTEQFHASGKSINEKVRLYVRVGQALIKGSKRVPAVAIRLPPSRP